MEDICILLISLIFEIEGYEGEWSYFFVVLLEEVFFVLIDYLRLEI